MTCGVWRDVAAAPHVPRAGMGLYSILTSNSIDRKRCFMFGGKENPSPILLIWTLDIYGNWEQFKMIIFSVRIQTHACQQQSSCTPTLQKHLCRQISKNISIFTAPDNTTPNRTTFKTNQCKGDLLFHMLLKRTHISTVRLIWSIHGLNGHCSVKNLDAIPSQKVASVI